MSSEGRSRWCQEAAGRAVGYDDRWKELAAEGRNVHGEADLVESLGPRTVLDAGCGTGRVAIELARRGIDVVGVDLDAAMLDVARTKAPLGGWVLADLLTLDLVAPTPAGPGRTFDAVVAAGNVMIYLQAGTEAAVVANLARHLGPGGVLVAGFQRDGDHLDVDAYDEHCQAGGLVLADRWATWDRQPYGGGDYAVSVHRRPS